MVDRNERSKGRRKPVPHGLLRQKRKAKDAAARKKRSREEQAAAKKLAVAAKVETKKGTAPEADKDKPEKDKDTKVLSKGEGKAEEKGGEKK